MKSKYAGIFEFHPVGHGMFYSGKIINANEKDKCFNFIYDCGRLRAANKLIIEISNYTDDLKSGTNELNLLVISHFHDDHINGLPKMFELFKKNNTVIKTVIMPYISFIERIILAEDFLKENIEKDENDKKNYLDFILFPIEYLLKAGVEEILIMKTLGDSMGNKNEMQNKDLLNEIENDSQIIEDQKNRIKIIDYFFPIQNFEKSEALPPGVWEFFFFNYNIKKTIDKIKEGKYNENEIKHKLEDEINKKNPKNWDSLYKLIVNIRKDLKKAYPLKQMIINIQLLQ